MPAQITKLINELRASYPELADEPLLDQIDEAAYELAPAESAEEPAEEPADAEAPEAAEDAEVAPSEDEFALPPGIMKKRSKAKPAEYA